VDPQTSAYEFDDGATIIEWWRHQPTGVVLVTFQRPGGDRTNVLSAFRHTTAEQWVIPPDELTWDDGQELGRLVDERRHEFAAHVIRPQFDANRQRADIDSDLGALGWA